MTLKNLENGQVMVQLAKDPKESVGTQDPVVPLVLQDLLGLSALQELERQRSSLDQEDPKGLRGSQGLQGSLGRMDCLVAKDKMD